MQGRLYDQWFLNVDANQSCLGNFKKLQIPDSYYSHSVNHFANHQPRPWETSKFWQEPRVTTERGTGLWDREGQESQGKKGYLCALSSKFPHSTLFLLLLVHFLCL